MFTTNKNHLKTHLLSLNTQRGNRTAGDRQSASHHLKLDKLMTLMATGLLVFGFLASAQAEQEDSAGARSLSVNYENQTPAHSGSRYDGEINQAQQLTIEALEKSSLNGINTMNQNTASRKTRDEVIAEREAKFLNNKQNAESIDSSDNSPSNSKHAIAKSQSNHYVEFSIYDASTKLFEDADYDGFYQSFSVTFDADVYSDYYNEQARVFAHMYLRRDDGPWELYFTTDTFDIVDDSSEDKYEVMTNLDVGFRAGHYDVLIDLYELGYRDVVASASSADLEALYALPLESADRDIYYRDESSVKVSAGGISIYTLGVLISAVVLRLKSKSKQ